MTTKTKNKSWYEIKALKNAVEISIYDEIGGWGVSAKDFADDLKQAGGAENITLRINSPGGSVFDGMAIYNQIKQHKAQVTVYIDGLAASIASVIAMAGDLVVMPENAMMMIHNPWTMAAGDAKKLRSNADLLDKIKSTMLSAYSSKTGLDNDAISAIMDSETWLTGAEAVEQGFADEAEQALDIAASLKDFDLSKFKNNPFASPKASAADQEPVSHLSAVVDITQKEGDMPTNENPTKVDVTAAVDDAVKAALAIEETRKADITAAFGDFAKDHSDLLSACLVDGKVSVADAQAKLLKAMGEGVTPVSAPSATVEVLATGGERFKKDASEALMARAGKGTADGSNPLKGLRLDAIAQKSLELVGVSTGGMDSRKLVAAAFTQSGSDFPVLLENTMHKVLQNAYATQEDTWSRFCSIGSVSDFRAHNRYRTGSFGSLDSINEAGEFKNKSIPDGEKSTITAGTKGNIVNITREAIINDDLGAFVNMASDLGRAARLTIEKDVYALLALNGGLGPTMSDGNSLFHASHNNIGGGSAISMAALDADAALMAYQMDVSANEVLDLSPAALLVARTLYGTAKGINDAPYDPDTTGKLQKPNIVSGLFSDIIGTARLTGTRRYMFADPNLAPVIEVAFLNGEQSPFLDTQDGFTSDGVKWKVRLDYGIAGIDYRGAVTDAGA